MADSKYYKFDVVMSCSGCSGAINRSLTKWKTTEEGAGNPAIEEFDVDLENQTVKIKAPTTVSYESIHDRIAKTGKEIKTGGEVEAW